MNKGCVYALIVSILVISVATGILIAGYFLFNVSSKETIMRPGDIHTVKPGYTVIVELDENPTTGYKWYYEIENEKILKLESDKYIGPTTKADGAGGTHIWRFKALDKGATKITFQYLRSWEKDKKPAKVYEFVINVE